jgi:hypothetical protein
MQNQEYQGHFSGKIHPNEKNYYQKSGYETEEVDSVFTSQYNAHTSYQTSKLISGLRFRFVAILIVAFLVAAGWAWTGIQSSMQMNALNQTIEQQASQIDSLQNVVNIHGTQPKDGSVCYNDTVNHHLEHWHVDIRTTLNSNGTLSDTQCGPN